MFEGVPAPANLVVPPYKFIDDTHIMIGVDPARSRLMAHDVRSPTGNQVLGLESTDRAAAASMPMYRKHMTEYYAPKNFNFWYFFGSLALVVLVNQIVTGIFLTMFYKPARPRHSPRSSTSCATSSGAG